MSCEWRQMKWGDLIRLQYGKRLTDYDEGTGKYRVYGTNGPVGWTDKPICEHEGIIVGRKGAYRGIKYSPAPFFVIDTAFYVEPITEFDWRWAYYAMLQIDLDSYDSGSAIPSTSRDTFEQIPVLVPPLPEQKRIAYILGILDDKIDLNRKMNRTLEAMARAIFKSWFIDFDPVHAKQRGEQPTGLDPETAALFPDRLTDSKLGMIPEGWEVQTIGDIAKIYGGGTPKTKNPEYWEPAKHFWATPKDLSNVEMPILLDTARKISDAGRDKVTNGERPPGTLLMSKRAPIGYLAIARVPTSINQGFIAMEFKSHISNYFMLNWLHFNMDLVKSRANGSTFKEISQREFKKLQLVTPPAGVIQHFDDLVGPLYAKIEMNMKESTTLERIRDILLPELLGG